MKNNDTDLFVIELVMTTQDLQTYTDWDYKTSQEWLQNNWDNITESVDVSFDGVLQSMIGYADENN